MEGYGVEGFIIPYSEKTKVSLVKLDMWSICNAKSMVIQMRKMGMFFQFSCIIVFAHVSLSDLIMDFYPHLPILRLLRVLF